MKSKIKKISSVMISLILVAVMSVTSVVSVNAAATNTGARIYSNFKTSPAYKNYSQFKSLYNATYTTVMPGMKNTNVNGTNCTTMVPQGICFAKDYMLVSAYDSLEKCNSVLYVISNTDTKNRKFVATLVLPVKSHVGGIAFDGSYVWITNNGKKVSSIKYTTLVSKINAAKANSNKSTSIAFTTTCSVLTQSSFMTYYDGRLWVGEFKEKGAGDGNMYAYTISSDRKKLTKKYRMTVPDRTQGVCFKDGYLVVSRSYSRKPTGKTYISQLRVYKPSFSSPAKDGLIKKNSCRKTITLPPMVEGLVVGSTYMYSIYESCATKYYTGNYGGGKCPAPVDRIVAFKFRDVVK